MRWQYQQSTKGVHLNKSTDHTGQLIIAPTTVKFYLQLCNFHAKLVLKG